MSIATIDENGRIHLPESVARERSALSASEYWLEQREGALVLHPRSPDIHRIYVEPTTKCNFRCRTCIRNVWEDPEASMSAATFERLLDSVRRLPALKRVVFTGFGEPLAHPQILSMIQAVRELGIAVSVGSNGALLTADVSAELVRLGVDRLVVSLDGVQATTYADVRGAALSPVVENIRSLGEVKRRLGSALPMLGIEFVLLKRNVSELSPLTALASQLGATRVLVSNVLPYTEEMREEVLYGYEPRAPFSPRGWPVRMDAYVMWGNMELPRLHWAANRRCRFIQDRATVVGWDGSVAPCYALSHNYTYYAVDGKQKRVSRYSLGNLEGQALAEIWMSEEYVRFRAEVRDFRFPSCPDCDLRDSCDLRERNEGCWGWNPSCADCLWAQDIVRCP